jgi:hypothetical protein
VTARSSAERSAGTVFSFCSRRTQKSAAAISRPLECLVVLVFSLALEVLLQYLHPIFANPISRISEEIDNRRDRQLFLTMWLLGKGLIIG